MALLVGVTAALVSASDEISAEIAKGASGTLSTFVSGELAGAIAGTGIVGLIAGGLVILAALGIWAELLCRSALIYLAVLGGSAHLRGERPSVGGRAAPPVRRRGARSHLLEDRRRPRTRDRLGDALGAWALELLRRRDGRASRSARRVARRLLRAVRAAPPAARRRGDHRRRGSRSAVPPGRRSRRSAPLRRSAGSRRWLAGSPAPARHRPEAGARDLPRRAPRHRGRRPRHRRAAPPRHVPLRLVPRGPRARELPDRAHTPRPRRGPRARLSAPPTPLRPARRRECHGTRRNPRGEATTSGVRAPRRPRRDQHRSGNEQPGRGRATTASPVRTDSVSFTVVPRRSSRSAVPGSASGSSASS